MHKHKVNKKSVDKKSFEDLLIKLILLLVHQRSLENDQHQVCNLRPLPKSDVCQNQQGYARLVMHEYKINKKSFDKKSFDYLFIIISFNFC